jgi:20S proteasome alpha/beta subunit
MTVIVGLETENGVIIGGDSATVSSIEFTIAKTESKKVFRVGEFLIGCAGSFRMMQVLRYGFKADKQNPELMSDEEYLAIVFTRALRDCFEDNAYRDFESNEGGGEFLLGYNGNLYVVCPDYQVNRSSNGFNAVGGGATYALGSLATSEGHEPMERVKKALEVSAHLSAGVRGPFYIETQGI